MQLPACLVAIGGTGSEERQVKTKERLGMGTWVELVHEGKMGIRRAFPFGLHPLALLIIVRGLKSGLQKPLPCH
jgi:hypothetical protein